MSSKIFNKICNLTQDEDVFYVASGKLNQNILQSIVSTTRGGVYDNKKNIKYSDTQTDSLIAIVIEMTQNVSKYREEVENYNNDLILITTNNNIKISTSNLTNRKDKESISKSIDFLNSLNDKELRSYSRTTIRKMRNENENTAGLGLIEIARLSKVNIFYEFNEYKQDDSLFHFNMTVSL